MLLYWILVLFPEGGGGYVVHVVHTCGPPSSKINRKNTQKSVYGQFKIGFSFGTSESAQKICPCFSFHETLDQLRFKKHPKRILNGELKKRAEWVCFLGGWRGGLSISDVGLALPHNFCNLFQPLCMRPRAHFNHFSFNAALSSVQTLNETNENWTN